MLAGGIHHLLARREPLQADLAKMVTEGVDDHPIDAVLLGVACAILVLADAGQNAEEDLVAGQVDAGQEPGAVQEAVVVQVVPIRACSRCQHPWCPRSRVRMP